MKPFFIFQTFCFMFALLLSGAGGTIFKGKAEGSFAEGRAEGSLKTTPKKYKLQYRFTAGETIKTRVTHAMKVKTTIKGTAQTARSHTISTKVWKVERVKSNGNITFVHSVSHVSMTNKVSDRLQARFDSAKDKTPPPAFAFIAKSVGKPLARIEITPYGKVVSRKDFIPNHFSGGSQLIYPLPSYEVGIGDRWALPQVEKVTLRDGTTAAVKTRMVFQLEKVKENLATIKVNTQILTTGVNPRVKVQLVQQLTKGRIYFDIKRGRLFSQKLHLNEQVISFNGPESMMEYLGQYTEQPIVATAKKTPTEEPSQSKVKSVSVHLSDQPVPVKKQKLPKTINLTDQDKEEQLKKLNIKDTHLPAVQVSDQP